MAENFGVTESQETQDNLICGGHPPVTKPIEVGLTIAGGTLPRGQILGRKSADGRYYEFNPAGGDGTQTAVGVLARAVSTVTNERSVMYVHGEFEESACTWKSGTTNAQKLAAILALDARGIYLCASRRPNAWTTTTTTTTTT